MKCIGASYQDQLQGIHFTLIDYLELLDWTGRIIRQDKHGVIPTQTPALLNTLGLNSAIWLNLANDFGKEYHGAVGSIEELALFAEHTSKQ